MFVGNTGYGYGDTEIVALSERLMTCFARRLDGSLSVGEALQYAKAEYAADLTAYGVYDEKALMEATFYGLPFYRLDVADPPPVPPLPPAPVISTDPITGIDTSTIEVTPVTEEREADDGATYWVGIGDDGEELTTAVHDRPVQPRDETSFTAPAGTEAHDALVLGLTTTDLHGIEPHILQPVVDDGDERSGRRGRRGLPVQPGAGEPAAHAGRRDVLDDGDDRLLPHDRADGSGIQRLVDDDDRAAVLRDRGERRLHPRDVPTGRGDRRGRHAHRWPSTWSTTTAGRRIKRVYVLVVDDPEHGSSSTWQAVDLVRTPGSRWTGSIPVTGEEIEYVVQAVDAAGNVAITTNKALNFRDEALPTDPAGSDAPAQAGRHRGRRRLVHRSGDVHGDRRHEPHLRGRRGVRREPVLRTGHRLLRRTAHGDRAQWRRPGGRPNGQDRQHRSRSPWRSRPSNGAVIARDGGATAQFACLDAGSGATSCSATLTVRPGYGNTGGTTAPIEYGADVSEKIGRHTLTVTAGPDLAGNRPQTATGSSTFAVVPPPRVDMLSLPGSHTGTTRSVGAAWTGVAAAGPYTTKWAWGDGTTTTCTTGQSNSSCSSSIAARVPARPWRRTPIPPSSSGTPSSR